MKLPLVYLLARSSSLRAFYGITPSNMKKLITLEHKPNLTGRIFLCIARDDFYFDNFEDHFNIMDTYLEPISHALPEADLNLKIESIDNEYLMIDKRGNTMFVDADCFTLQVDTLHPLVLMPYNIN